MKGGFFVTIVLLLSGVFASIAQENTAVLSLSDKVRTGRTPEDFPTGPVQFHLRQGMILLDGTLDGRGGLFILDTGSPGLVINQLPRSSGSIEAYSPTGSVAVEEIEVESLELGALRYSELEGLAINLSHMEQSMQCSLIGMVGFELFQEFDLLLDYPQRQVSFMNESDFLPTASKEVLEFDLLMYDHLPVVKVNIHGKPLYLGLDTGTGANILDASLESWVREIGSIREGGQRVRGLNQRSRRASSTWLWMESQADALPEPSVFLLTDLRAVQRQLDGQLDGLLGYSFFQNKKVLFSFRNQKMYVWR